MELIKQIKDAENQAKEIAEKARRDAVALIEQTRSECQEQLRKTQQKRHQTIVEAVTQAQEETQSRVQELVEQGRKEIESLKQACQGKLDPCVAKIVSRLEQA